MPVRKKLIASLEQDNPELHHSYLQAKEAASKTLDHVRRSRRFPLTGKGTLGGIVLNDGTVAPGNPTGLLGIAGKCRLRVS